MTEPTRREFLQYTALAGGGVALASFKSTAQMTPKSEVRIGNVDEPRNVEWPVLKRYDRDHLVRIALPIGGIGAGTISLGGRGNLQDWEIRNTPEKGVTPILEEIGPFFALNVRNPEGKTWARALEGPIDPLFYEGASGATVPNHGLPRFRDCSFAAAYPLGQVFLSDPEVPVEATLQAFNPLIPGDADASGIPIAVLRFVLANKTDGPLNISVCAVIPNTLEGGNRKNEYRTTETIRGIFMDAEGANPNDWNWGTVALSTISEGPVSFRTRWPQKGWRGTLLKIWDDFSVDGEVERAESEDGAPIGTLAVRAELPARGKKEVTFLITWHFPNRRTWSPIDNENKEAPGPDHPDWIGNYYTTQFSDAWNVAAKIAPDLADLERKTLRFVDAFCRANLPAEVKEAALFNISTLRTQTCFRTPDGRFYGFEGCNDRAGCCMGSCTHVWNYEQATGFLFGDLAMSMREVSFGQATDEIGLMRFRVKLPLKQAMTWESAAADGQMGTIMRMHRDWQLSGDDERLKQLWPHVKKSLEFCWIEGGWDADKDGVMEGCQHNTMDVEYYGPNPQMGIWYLGALRACEEMARYLGEEDFAETCQGLFEKGRDWIDANLFNGEYYEHKVQPPKDASQVAPSLRAGMGASDMTKPDFQLGPGCLVDQLVGQFQAHVCGLGYLVDPDHVRATLEAILKYNRKDSLFGHFNNMRSFALGDEAALLMASYPKDRPEVPFPYFTEVMTGFEYTAAVGMLYEGMVDEGLRCIADIRARYDGRKRSPFDEAECGHHYVRAMASWAAVLALSGFGYSGVEKILSFAKKEGRFFWSNGYAWGECEIADSGPSFKVTLSVLGGELSLAEFHLGDFGKTAFAEPLRIGAGEQALFKIASE
jgi:uncharacterized protein (DUF608 family)